MDPLSDVLSLLRPRSYVSAGFDAGGDWSIQFSSQRERIKCYAVISGACWLAVEGVSEPVRPVSAIALAFGYESESAFSTAFKRSMGCSPRQYGQRRRQTLSAASTHA